MIAKEKIKKSNEVLTLTAQKVEAEQKLRAILCFVGDDILLEHLITTLNDDIIFLSEEASLLKEDMNNVDNRFLTPSEKREIKKEYQERIAANLELLKPKKKAHSLLVQTKNLLASISK